MRVLFAAFFVLILSALSACGGADKPESSPTASASSPTRYEPCDLLSPTERVAAAGIAVDKDFDYRGNAHFYYPAWSCRFGDAPQVTATTSIEYLAMRAPIWAAKLPEIIATTPSEQNAPEFFTAVLKQAHLTEEDLANLDSATACKLWEVYNTRGGYTVEDHVTVYSESHKELGLYFVRASTCADGTYSEVFVAAPDADSQTGRDRATDALSLVHQRAVTKLPKTV